MAIGHGASGDVAARRSPRGWVSNVRARASTPLLVRRYANSDNKAIILKSRQNKPMPVPSHHRDTSIFLDAPMPIAKRADLNYLDARQHRARIEARRAR